MNPFAVLSMVFAGGTSVTAKKGLAGISGELGLAVRTVFVFGFVALFASMFVKSSELKLLTTITPRSSLLIPRPLLLR